MRFKIIIVNAAIVLVVGILSYVILLTNLGDALSDRNGRTLAAERATRSANAQFALEAFRVERWLGEQAERESVREVFGLGTSQARSEAATVQSNSVIEAAAKTPLFAGMQPTLVLFVDRQGIALGRNNTTTLMRGEPMAEHYPSLLTTLKDGRQQSAVWLNPERQEQMFATYAAVHGSDGALLGLLILGSPLNDERLDRVSALTSGEPLIFAARRADGRPDVIARSAGVPAPIVADQNAVVTTALAAIQSGKFQIAEGVGHSQLLGAAPLSGYGGAQGALVAVVPATLIPDLGTLLWPVWGATALGVLLVIIAGTMVAAYISRPISQLEEGLLMIINGKTDMRFELEHEELGGLVFRINSLLNALTGVAEGDDTSPSSTLSDP